MEKQRIKIFGIIGFILGITSVLAACISPIAGIIISIVGFVLSILGSTKNKGLKGLAIAGIVINVIAFLLCGISSFMKIDDSQSNSTIELETTELSGSEFSVKDYSFHDGVDNTMYVLVIKNNSNNTVDISGEATALDDSENKLGVSDDYSYCIEPSEETCLQFYYDTDNATKFKYSIDYKTSDYDSIVDNLSFEESQNEKNVVVTCKNNSDVTSSSIQAKIIFFNGDSPISCTNAYIGDDSGNLASGESADVELDSAKMFDNYKIYYSAR